MSARDDVRRCFLAHPGRALAIADVTEWIANHGERQWKDISTTLADLVIGGAPSSKYRDGRQFLERVDKGVYRMATRTGSGARA